MTAGSVVVTSIIQSNNENKMRPTVLLKQIPPYNDWLVCPVSSKTHNLVPGLDLLIKEEDEDFKTMSLQAPSIIRIGKLQAIPEKTIRAEIGRVTDRTYTTMIEQLVTWLKKDQ